MSEPLVTTETANVRGTYIFFCFCFLILSGTHVSESKKQECKTATKDVVFLLDTSGSVGAVAFEEVLNFTKAIVSTFRIGPQNTLVGIETFASIVHHQFALDVNKNMATLLTAIDSIPYQSGGTNIVAGLEYVIKNSFKAGGRRNADKILILVTDGQTYSPNATAMQVKSLRKTNIKVFCIGVGLYVDPKELQHIASGANHTLLIKDYDSLSNTIRKLHAAICKDILQESTTPHVLSTTKRTAATTNIRKFTKRTTTLHYASTTVPTTFTTKIKPNYVISKTRSPSTVKQALISVHAFPTTRKTSATTNIHKLTKTTTTDHTSTTVPTTLTNIKLSSTMSKMRSPSTVKEVSTRAYIQTLRMTKFVSPISVKAHNRISTTKQSATEERKTRTTIHTRQKTNLETTNSVSRNRKAPVYLRDFIHGFEYLEVAILTLVTVIAIGAFGCCCRFCVLFAKRREREEEEKPKRQQPCKRPKDWPSY